MMLELAPRYQGQVVRIVNGNWDEEDTRNIPRITHWAVTVLRLNRNNRESLVKEIAHIHFTHLTQLWLWENMIQSIEGLPLVDMPHIQQLYLSQNRILSVRALRKARWDSLSLLSICKNYVRDMRSLAEAGFGNLRRLIAFSDIMSKEKNKFHDPWFPSKLQTPSLIVLRIQANKFSMDRSTPRVFSNKWQQISID